MPKAEFVWMTAWGCFCRDSRHRCKMSNFTSFKLSWVLGKKTGLCGLWPHIVWQLNLWRCTVKNFKHQQGKSRTADAATLSSLMWQVCLKLKHDIPVHLHQPSAPTDKRWFIPRSKHQNRAKQHRVCCEAIYAHRQWPSLNSSRGLQHQLSATYNAVWRFLLRSFNHDSYLNCDLNSSHWGGASVSQKLYTLTLVMVMIHVLFHTTGSCNNTHDR